MLLVDASIWILAEHGRFQMPTLHGAAETLAICPAIVLEVLRGTRPERYAANREILLQSQFLDDPTPFDRFEEAAQLYLRCRDAGVTVRSSIDCLVAATALAHDAVVFHDDRDYENIRRVVPLRTITRSSIAERSK